MQLGLGDRCREERRKKGGVEEGEGRGEGEQEEMKERRETGKEERKEAGERQGREDRSEGGYRILLPSTPMSCVLCERAQGLQLCWVWLGVDSGDSHSGPHPFTQ